MKNLLLLLLLAGFLASCGGGSGGAYSALFGYEPKHLQPAQQSTYWARVYGGTGWDEARSIQQTTDGGYIVAGSFGVSIDNADVWVLKLNPDGSIAWQKTYGGASVDEAYSVQQTSDGGYIVAGWTASFGVGGDAWVLKLDSNGNIQWQKTYGGTGYDWANFIQQTSDGGYIMVGETDSFGAGLGDAWVLKLDSNGNIQWQKTYGGTDWDTAYSVQQTSDGGYIVAGATESFGAGYADVWVLKLDSNGNIQWQKTYGRTGWDEAYSVQQTSDGGYIVAGIIDSFGAGPGYAWVLKLDQNGNVVWQKTYGGASGDVANSVQQTSDGGYIVAGGTASFGAGGPDVWLLKLDQNGNIQWQKTYGGASGDVANSVQQTSDGGYIVAGWTTSFGVGGDAWVLKLDQNGDIPTPQPSPEPTPTPSPTPQPSPEPTPGGGGGAGGCSMGVGTSPINAFAYLLLPMLVALRRFIRR